MSNLIDKTAYQTLYEGKDLGVGSGPFPQVRFFPATDMVVIIHPDEPGLGHIRMTRANWELLFHYGRVPVFPKLFKWRQWLRRPKWFFWL